MAHYRSSARAYEINLACPDKTHTQRLPNYSSMNTKYKTNILLVEDNPGDTELIRIYLQDAAMKAELHQAETLYDATEIIASRQIDLTLLDLSLPDSNGFRTLTKYLKRASHIPVIVLTGMNNEIIGNQAVKAGAQDFLVKGQFDGKLLGRAVRYALQRFKEQQKLEEAAHNLAVSEKRYIEAQEMAQFGNWEMDIVTNEMKWTKEVFRIFNFQPGSISPSLSDYISYVHLEDREKTEEFFEAAAKDGKLHTLEHRIILEGSSVKYLSVQAKVNYDELTQKLLLIGAMQDITARKLTERLIIEKNIQSRTAKIKEAALREMSFNIRTPLSSIVNLLYLLENTRVNAQQKDYLGNLKLSVDDLSIAITNLLNFSVLVSDNVKVEEEEFNLREFMQSMHRASKIKADNAKLNLTLNIEESLPEKIISDQRKLTQVLHNLTDNAIRYTAEGGSISLDAKAKNIHNDKFDLHLYVTDNGRGISPQKLKEIPEADKLLEVYAEEDTAENNPLGLAIVAKLTKTLGGELKVQSKVGKGSTFEIVIPVRAVKVSRSTGTGVPEVPLKILLVEDHFLNQIATKRLLTTWSELVSVDIAENGLVGVEKYREHGYDLILMDIQMPVMNGIESARRIREKSDVPIIALTANSTSQEQEKCFEVGMNDYLPKPFKPHELYNKIMHLMSMVMN